MSQQNASSGVIGTARRRMQSAQRVASAPLVTQPRLASGYSLLDAHAFRNAMNVLIARERAGFTILVIRPEHDGGTLALGDTILRQVRSATGDLAGYLDAAIAVVLRCTDHVGAVAFADRVREYWRRGGHGELLCDIAEHPYAEQRVIELLTTDWSASSWMPVLIDDNAPIQDQRSRSDGKRVGVAKRQ